MAVSRFSLSSVELIGHLCQLMTRNVQLGPPCKTINDLHLFSSTVSLWILPLHPLSTNAQFINIVLSLLSSSSSFFPNTLPDREILRQLPKWQVKLEQEALERDGCHGNGVRGSDYMRGGQVNPLRSVLLHTVAWQHTTDQRPLNLNHCLQSPANQAECICYFCPKVSCLCASGAAECTVHFPPKDGECWQGPSWWHLKESTEMIIITVS